ncbi:MAG: hypothetical protein KJ879_03860, partial [Nanoarchaeota archaeon]|nr:hypothetical protein [Nanoarchaeota archaeon]
ATSLNNLVSLTGLNEPYFQYITLFSIKKLDVDSASLTSAVVGYTLLDPAIVINSPVAQGYSSGEVNVNVSFDESFDLSESWYSLDAGLTNITLIGGNATLNLGEGNHNLIVYANDTSGILELKEVSFSIDILSCSDKIYGLCADTASCTAAGGYWYDDTCNGTAPPAVANSSTESAASAEATTSSSSEEDNSVVTVPVPKPTSPIVFETINDTTLGSGDLQELYLKINNSGKGFLFACNPTAVGNYSSWISYEGGSKNINPGEEVVFDLSVNVPSDVEEGSYSIPLSVGCSDGVSASTDYNIIIKEEKLELDIVSVQRAGSDHVRVSYILKELAGEDQEVNVSFSLLDLNNSEIAGATELKSIVAESSQEFNMDIPFGGDLGSDELNLKANLNSEIYSSSVLEPVTLGGSIGGFAIFDFRNIGRGRAVLFLAVLFALIILFIVLRKIRKSREKKDPKK